MSFEEKNIIRLEEGGISVDDRKGNKEKEKLGMLIGSFLVFTRSVEVPQLTHCREVLPLC